MDLLKELYEGSEIVDPAMERFISNVKRNCSIYIQSGIVLLRGSNRLVPDGSLIRGRTNRRPRDTDLRSSNFYSLVFEYFHDIDTVRSRSLFCTESIGTASAYGRYVYMVFPTDETQYIYNPRVRDTKGIAENAKKMFDVQLDMSDIPSASKFESQFEELLSQPHVTLDDLKQHKLLDVFEYVLRKCTNDIGIKEIVNTTISDTPCEVNELALINSSIYVVNISDIRKLAARLVSKPTAPLGATSTLHVCEDVLRALR